MDTLTRGRLAKRCGVNIEAVRYYEKQGLIGPPDRTPAGYRLYSPDDALKIRFIKNAQKLGFTLKEIGELLNLRVRNPRSCDPVRKKAQKKLDEVERKVRDLNSMKRVLKQLIGKCRESEPTGNCPILSSFESGKKI